ncbi:MAG TPA: alpha/beta fold hydrolase [Gaiellaceae bacterium]
MRLRALIAPLAAVAFLIAPHTAAAGLQFAPCGKGAVDCATVSVPLDRTGSTPGSVSLYVERLQALGAPRGVMFLVAGGPGQASAGAFDLESSGSSFRDQFPGYTLIAFDPRGTGRSGVLRCPELQADPSASPSREQALVARCAEEIGASRQFYSTREHADDIDAVRQALGVDKVALWGTSYGTQLAVSYALTYPTHVERLLLDSVADPAGRDPFSADDLREMPKGLAELCPGSTCRAATPSFVRDVVTLANRLGARSLQGAVPRPGGGRATVKFDGVDFLSGVVIDSDLNAGLTAELPAAVRAALHGRPRALLRLVQLDRESSVLAPEDLSMGLLAATVCDDGPFPWQPLTPLTDRPALFSAALGALPDGALGPFGKWAAQMGPAALCLLWPPQPAGRGIGAGPLPNVPVLVLSGSRDLRTPTAQAAAVAARFPQGRLLIVPGVGHSVLSADLTGCAESAVKTWLAGGTPPTRCRRSPAFVPPLAAFPASVEALKPAGATGLRGRTLAGVSRTVREAAATWALAVTGFASAPRALAGPYGGTVRVAGISFSLSRYSIVPGLEVTGKLDLHRPVTGSLFPLRFVGSVTVGGAKAAQGRLRIGPARLAGKLGGRAVSGPAAS